MKLARLARQAASSITAMPAGDVSPAAAIRKASNKAMVPRPAARLSRFILCPLVSLVYSDYFIVIKYVSYLFFTICMHIEVTLWMT